MSEQDRIGQVFRGSTVFITGGTGFLGKVLTEKLLRCCNVRKVYLLIRTKKGKTPHERLDDVFSNALFDLLKSQDPKAISKCQVISGDITQDQLGISPEDLFLLQKEVDFIFHSAASTRFDDSVKTAVKFNTKSTKELLDLAEGCKKLKALLHVSTAYAFPKEEVLYERACKPPQDPHKVLKLVELSQDQEIEWLLGDDLNSYSFSKALAESLVVDRINKVPAVIVRPSVVCPVWGEPLKGWCNNLQGPMGLFVGAAKGIIRTMYMKGDFPADFVPADMVINAMLILVWHYVEVDKKQRIVNVTASHDSFSWEELIETGKSVIYNEVPFNDVVWYPGGSIKRIRWVHNLCFFLFQLAPAIFIDAVLIILGYKPILFQIQRRIHKGSKMLEYYTNRSWNFSIAKSSEIRNQMNKLEKQLYKVDRDGVDLRNYFKDCLMSVRRNNLKETDETIPRAIRHLKIMWFVDVVFKLVLLGVVLYCSYQLVWKVLQRIL